MRRSFFVSVTAVNIYDNIGRQLESSRCSCTARFDICSSHITTFKCSNHNIFCKAYSFKHYSYHLNIFHNVVDMNIWPFSVWNRCLGVSYYVQQLHLSLSLVSLRFKCGDLEGLCGGLWWEFGEFGDQQSEGNPARCSQVFGYCWKDPLWLLLGGGLLR